MSYILFKNRTFRKRKMSELLIYKKVYNTAYCALQHLFVRRNILLTMPLSALDSAGQRG